VSARIFVDSAAYYAITDRHDANHSIALATARRMAAEVADLYTTNAVVIETHSLLLNRLSRDLAAQVLERIYAGTTKIVRAVERDEHRGREIIRQHDDKEFSFTDAISFAVMERLQLRLAWTYDNHFAQFGFQIVS
jgi:predicted nucleic acid-binding protein